MYLIFMEYNLYFRVLSEVLVTNSWFILDNPKPRQEKLLVFDLAQHCLYFEGWYRAYTLKPHCIQFSPVLVPSDTCRSTSRRHHLRPGIQAVTRVMAYVANAVTLWRWLQQCVPAALRALTWSTLNWLNRIQCAFSFLSAPCISVCFGTRESQQCEISVFLLMSAFLNQMFLLLTLYGCKL
jgi:hypothetical protein